MSSRTKAVIDFAKTMSGVVTRSEAIALGVPPSTLDRMVTSGILERRRPGVYTLPGVTDAHLVMLHVACRKLAAVASHMSAASIHELVDSEYVKPTVSVPRRRTKDLVGVTVHQLTDLADDHIKVVSGLPVTTAERTVVDLAAVISDRRLGAVVDNGLASGRLDINLLKVLQAEIGRQGKPGTVRLRTILASRGSGYTAPESELERRLLALIEDAGLPEPDRQFRPHWLRPSHGRVDLAYPEQQLAIEGDSRRWHTLLNSFEVDRLRDNAAQLAGWRILRFTWIEINDYPERVAATIAKALRR